MQIDIQARDFSLTDALRSYAQRRLRFALTNCHDHIQRIAIRLSDINGPRGGNDKRCVVQVVMAGMPDVVIEDTESDLYVAIDRASARAERTLKRKVGRKRTLLTQAPRVLNKARESLSGNEKGREEDWHQVAHS